MLLLPCAHHSRTFCYCILEPHHFTTVSHLYLLTTNIINIQLGSRCGASSPATLRQNPALAAEIAKHVVAALQSRGTPSTSKGKAVYLIGLHPLGVIYGGREVLSQLCSAPRLTAVINFAVCAPHSAIRGFTLIFTPQSAIRGVTPL